MHRAAHLRRRAAPPLAPCRPVGPRFLLAALLLLSARLSACTEPIRELERPNLVAMGPGGEVYVSDFHHQRIVVFDDQGGYQGEFGSQGLGVDQLWRVWGLAVRPDGSLLVVQERPVAHDDQTVVWELKVFTDRRQTAVHSLVTPDWDGDRWIEGLTALPDGGWLVCDQERGVMLRFGADGSYRGPWGPASAEPPLSEPCPAEAAAGAVWVLEEYYHRLRRITLDGTQEASFGTEGRAPGELRFPQAVASCTGQWIVVADLGNHRVQRYDWRGVYLDGFTPAPVGPKRPVQMVHVAVSADCSRVYLVDSKGSRVLVTTPAGEPLDTLASW